VFPAIDGAGGATVGAIFAHPHVTLVPTFKQGPHFENQTNKTTENPPLISINALDYLK